ncbi:unnamed protein product [Ceutorhynchus assimilis]|uniref:Uncharacterized protein n=1 Tax=Ceutorhynchus assimilis TaxID=467358 RepID=A0A9N9MQ52_9CUCU|nr:unnamed protein product [Ceutorhynchus assimilis]
MDQGERTVRERNPREDASIFSIVFFFFTSPILKKGRKRDLQEKDIYQVRPKFESENLGNQLENSWNINCAGKERIDLNKNGIKHLEKHNNEEKTAIFKCLVRNFGCYYFCLGLMQLAMRTALIVLQPKAISKFVAYFEKGQTNISRSEVYGYALFVISVNLINCIYNHNYQQLIMEYSVKVRTSLCSLIYRKALKLNIAASSTTSMGKVVTLITKDVYCIDGALMFLNDMWIGIIQTIIITVMLYNRVGASVFAGIGFFILVIPIQSYCGRKFSFTRLEAAKKAEQRIQLVKEALNAIKIIKMYNWENYFEKLITTLRIKETDKLKVIYYLKATILTLGGLTMKVAFFLLIITYTLVGNSITAETLYFIQQCFFALRSCITTSIPMGISYMAELCAVMKRFQHFLSAPEFNQKSTTKAPAISPKVYLDQVSVKIQNQEVLHSVSIDIEKGLLVVAGNIGCGKSSLLKAILNEYPISKGHMLVRGSVSYTPEEPWLFPSTIRQNILFGQPYNEKRYQEVLNVCALTHDLNNFEKLDNTVVGDKGINLSKGQQARICLARAVYKNSDIYLLDDCLSALDAHVNNHVFRECIRGFLKDKLVILITNNINNIKQVPTGCILFMENGRTMDLNQQKAALDKRITYYIDEDNQYTYDGIDSDEENTSETDKLLLNKEATEPRRNLYYEENKQGSVLWKNYIAYYKYTGGIAVLLFTLVVFVLCQGALAYSDKLLSLWVNIAPAISNLTRTNQTDSETYQIQTQRSDKLLKFYILAIIIGTALTLLRSFANFYFCTRAGRQLHKVLVTGVLNAYMTFFDNHFIGNIVNRVSKDFHTIDENIPFIIYENLRSFFLVLATIGLIASVNYYFLIPSAVLFIILFFIQRYYIPTGRSLKRLEAATRSPMIGYINASLEGLTTVHACQQEKILQREFDRHQDFFTSAYYMNQCTVRVFAFSMDMTCIAFIACIVIKFAIFSEGVKAGDVGLAVSQAMTLTGLLQWAIRQAAEMENTMTSVERVLEYGEVESENKSGQELSKWPTAGSIKYNDVSLSYKTSEKVLKNISFEIEGKTKIGIVGRTGAGKSSIISTLFRLYNYEGIITIDNIDIKTLNVEYLRSNIGIIPQDPILFSGTIRSNIDPLNKYSDSEIWSAIEKVQMKSLVNSLEQEILDHGLNYSSGQRQLLCLARALVCKNKIIVLDEATANMDVETDNLLQKAIQNNFADCTVLTIAHRLHSVQTADKILVVEDGKIVQFDSPGVLWLDKDGLFYKMVRDAGGASSNFSFL